MNSTTLVYIVSIALLGLLLAIFFILLPAAIIFNTRAGMKYRTTLARQLNQLRLGKMLTALGIDMDSYLSSERVTDIHQQMERCSACGNTAECDTRLAEGSTDTDSIGYCNNEESLQKAAAHIKAQGVPD